MGYSSISFPAGFLTDRDSVLISFSYTDVGHVTFGPSGLHFEQPVVVAISYNNADLTDFNEDAICVWYDLESSEEWEYIGGEVDKVNKVVKGDLWHFSDYSLGEDN
jgi:hypothetical protein